MSESAKLKLSRRSVIGQSLGVGALAALSGSAAAEAAQRKAKIPADERSIFGEGRVTDIYHRIIKDFERPDPDLIARLKANPHGNAPVTHAGPLGTCGANGEDQYKPAETSGRSECKLGHMRALPSDIRPVRPGLKIMGPAFTVVAHDHLIPMYAIDLAQPGDVLVIDATALGPDVAVWGGSMNQSSASRQLGGVVIDGKHCDSGGFLTPRPGREVPLFTRGPAAANTTWELPGSINVPISISGRIIEPGDLVVGADDGIAIIPKRLIKEAVLRAEAYAEGVKYWTQEKNKGRTWFDILNLRGNLDRLGIPEFQGPSGA